MLFLALWCDANHVDVVDSGDIQMDPVADDVQMTENSPQNDVEAQVPGPQTSGPGWKVWKYADHCFIKQ